MKLYLSTPMTVATPVDLALEEAVVAAVREQGIEHYHPRSMEPKGLHMAALQAHDLKTMSGCDGLLTCWGPSAYQSAGVISELEWAVRIFRIPAVIYKPDPKTRIAPWCLATVNQEVYGDLETVLWTLRRNVSDSLDYFGAGLR